MVNFITHGITAVFAICLAMISGLFTRTITISPSGTAPETAIVYQAAIPSSTPNVAPPSSASAAAAVIASSSDHIIAVQQTSPASSSPKIIAPSPSKNSSISAQIKNTVVPPQPPPASLPPPPPAGRPAPTSTLETSPAIITAQWLLERTTLSLTQKLDGAYKVALATNAGTAGTFSWDLLASTIGGTGGIPQFKPSFSCVDPPDIPPPGASDESPSFQDRTSYVCNIALTALTGNDKRTQTKQFSFQTGPGRIIVSLASNINSVLQDGENDGGFVFNNEDTKPAVITSLALNLSFTALGTSTTPLVVRFKNPKDDSILAEYHMENLPGDSSSPYTQSATNVAIPISFTVGALDQKLLMADIFGVQKYAFNGVNPAVKIMIRGITANPSDAKVTLATPSIIWTCVVPTGAYDPNATSSPFMTGTACRN